MRATSVPRKMLLAVLAAAAFLPSFATTAHADVMAPGSYEGRITGGTLTLGNGSYQNLQVPGGTKFSFAIPAGATDVAWTAPGLHIDLPLLTDTDSGGTVRTATGSLDISAIAGSVATATGAVTGTGSAHGAVRLTSSPSFALWCYIGGDPSGPNQPVGFTLAGTGTLTAAFTANMDCGSLFGTGLTGLPIVGDMTMPSTLSLDVTFTRLPDPEPTIKVVTQTVTNTVTKTVTVTPEPAKCVVPKLKGLKLTKARKAATKANCTVGKVTRKKSSHKATVVLKQGKKAGAVLALGSKIALTVAR